MRRTNAATLQDVAREAGVTAMTVSVVLNGARSGTRVSDATRARIEEVAARLRYRPNGVARSLSRRRMDTLGVAAGISGQINLYFLDILNGILEAAATHGQNTTIYSVTDWEVDQSRLLQFCDGRVDGLILINPTLTAPFAATLGQYALFVTIQSTAPLSGIHSLDVDNEGAACEMVRYLIVQGHRRIAHITGSMTQIDAQLRLAGYRRALSEAGITPDESLVRPGWFTIDTGRQCMADLLDRPGPPPTAVFCANDATAYGAMETLAARGLRVPEDISVAGFDDLMLAQMTTPHLTTVHQPFQEMARRAVELLLHQIQPGEDDAPAPPDTEFFDAELTIRASVAPPHPDPA